MSHQVTSVVEETRPFAGMDFSLFGNFAQLLKPPSFPLLGLFA